MKKLIKISIAILLLSNYISAMEKPREVSIKELPFEVHYQILQDIVKGSKNLNQAIESFKNYAQKVLKSQRMDLINLLNQEKNIIYLKSIMNSFSTKFKARSFAVINKLGIILSDEMKQELKKDDIERVIKGHGFTFDDLDAWITVNQDDIKDNEKINNFIIQALNKPYGKDTASEAVIIIASLIYANINPNFKTEDGATALIYAARRGYKEIVELLLDTGADPNFKTQDGYTAFIYAALRGDKEIVELLLNADADPNVKDELGETALIYAVRWGYPEIVELLLNAKVDPNLKDVLGQTALMKAVSGGKKNIAQLLLNANADPTIKDNYNRTALAIAVKAGNKEIVDLLKEYGATE